MSSSKQLLKEVARIIPPLGHEMHKGQAGRVGVLGGSQDYTGAPFYSCMGAMRLGADLGHVICDPKAGSVIKTYSPDLIVHPVLEPGQESTYRDTLKGLLSRLHTLVVGPGLGRDQYMQEAAKTAISIARENDMYLVIDADGLWLIQNEPDVVAGYRKAVLTPNVVEFGRLCDKVGIDQKGDTDTLCRDLARKLGNVTIMQKGPTDIISNGEDVLKCDAEGGLKRCGGQGDILSGQIGTMMAWAKVYEEGVGRDKDPIPTQRLPLLATYGAAVLTRAASKATFAKLGRSMQTSDMLSEVGNSYESHFGSHSKL